MKKVIWYTGTKKILQYRQSKAGQLLTLAMLLSLRNRKKQKHMRLSVMERNSHIVDYGSCNTASKNF